MNNIIQRTVFTLLIIISIMNGSIANTDQLDINLLKRENIIFILGEDQVSGNRYYEIAESYYRTNVDTKNDLLITTCRSLNEILNYLNQHPTDNYQPWGDIRLIVHSNEWRGVGIPIEKGGKRINTNNLKTAIDKKSLTVLSTDIIDKNTVLEWNACGLGRNQKLVDLLGLAFGQCQVKASKYFMMYDNIENITNKYEADCYYAFSKTGRRINEQNVSNQLHQRYPQVDVDWISALKRKNPRYEGDSYHYYFNVPINWVVTYATEEDRPGLHTMTDKLNWLASQDELQKVIDKTNIPKDKFRWQFRYIIHTYKDGSQEPAILVKGKTSVLCILKARLEEPKQCGL